MYSKLPREVLEQIFTHRDIAKKDLLQLQLTCKQWSPIAKRHLYRDIDLTDKNLYQLENSSLAIEKRLALLTRTLLLLNRKNGEFIETVDFDSLLLDTPSNDPLFNVAVLAQLCPHITNLTGKSLSSEFFETLVGLHRQGNLQYLKAISDTDFSDEGDKNNLFTKYHTATLEFKNTLTSITVVDGICKTTSTECLITPASLQLFSCAEHLHLKELSRAHLYQIRNYISACGPSLTALTITMPGATISTPPAMEDDLLVVVYPNWHLQDLALNLEVPLTSEEMILVMRWFPSLKSLTLCLSLLSEDDLIYQYDMDVVVQFLEYLSLIPGVDYTMCVNVNQGLAYLPHLVNSIEIKSLSLISSDVMYDSELDFDLVKKPTEALSNDNTLVNSKAFDFTTIIVSNQAQAVFVSVLEEFKGRVIENVTIGVHPKNNDDGADNIDADNNGTGVNATDDEDNEDNEDDEDDEDEDDEGFQHTTLTHQSIGCLMDIDMQHLTFSGVKFPSHAPRLRTRRKCNISESYFTWLSCQLERINCLEILYAASVFSNVDRTIRIILPYTTLDTISFTVHGVLSYTIKVWVNYNCATLKATRAEDIGAITLEEIEVEDLSGDPEIIVYCAALTSVRCENFSYELP
ncbi:hypothetical protein MBANPS3_003015 [Mucor bainieri]